MEENQTVPALQAPKDTSFTEPTGQNEPSSNATTGRVRDVFIIFMALESLVIGVAMIVLIVQLATLINLLQNELKPIIHSTNETVNTLKGTVTFLSENLTAPVITLNSYLAGIKTFFDVFRPKRSKR
jgi:amino acid permease